MKKLLLTFLAFFPCALPAVAARVDHCLFYGKYDDHRAGDHIGNQLQEYRLTLHVEKVAPLIGSDTNCQGHVGETVDVTVHPRDQEALPATGRPLVIEYEHAEGQCGSGQGGGFGLCQNTRIKIVNLKAWLDQAPPTKP